MIIQEEYVPLKQQHPYFDKTKIYDMLVAANSHRLDGMPDPSEAPKLAAAEAMYRLIRRMQLDLADHGSGADLLDYYLEINDIIESCDSSPL